MKVFIILAVATLFFLFTANEFLLTANSQTPGASERIDLSLSSHDRRASLIPAGSTETIIEVIADTSQTGGDFIDVGYFVPDATVTLILPNSVEVGRENATTLGFTYGVIPEGAATDTPLAAIISSTGNHVLIKFPQSQPSGIYQVRVTIPATATATPVVVTYIPSSRVRAGLTTSAKAYRVGDTVILMALLFDELTPITGATVTAEVVDSSSTDAVPVQIALQDSGDHDSAPGDGIYTGTFTASQAGNFVTAIRASGASASGISFSRSSSAAFCDGLI